jgi:hypothetical protein
MNNTLTLAIVRQLVGDYLLQMGLDGPKQEAALVAVPRPLRHLDGVCLHLRTGPDANREMVDVPEVARNHAAAIRAVVAHRGG